MVSLLPKIETLWYGDSEEGREVSSATCPVVEYPNHYTLK